ncbi:MAG: recombinase family protein [Proteobacteria bacterium]|nr:MAG: recombinase family protein [Pseudomonadota bacterium]
MSSWKENRNKRSIAILRVSSKRQADNTSHEIQEREIVEYCNAHKLKLVKIFKITESAKNSEDRKQYKAAIDFAIREGAFHLLFYMQDRESRNMRDLEYNEQLVKDNLIVIHYVHDRKVLDKSSSESDFLTRDFQGVINKQYSRILSTKVKDAQRNKAENGWYPGGRTPLGYIHVRPNDLKGREIKRAPTMLVPDTNSENVRLVQREFELKAKGFTLDKIREVCLAEGLVPNRLIDNYHRTDIDWRLHNKIYYGRFDWDGAEYEGKHELIVPQPILQAVNIALAKNLRYVHSDSDEAIFSGWLRCGFENCNCSITFEKKVKVNRTTGQKTEYFFYRCANHRKVHTSLKGLYVSENSIWKQFEGAIDAISISPKLAKDIANALNANRKSSSETSKNECSILEIQIRKLEDRKNRLFDLFMDKHIDEGEYREQLKRIVSERTQLTDSLRELNFSKGPSSQITENLVFELARTAKVLWKSGSRFERLSLLKRLCSNQVLEGQTLRFDLKKPFTLLSEMKGCSEWWGLQDSNL